MKQLIKKCDENKTKVYGYESSGSLNYELLFIEDSNGIWWKCCTIAPGPYCPCPDDVLPQYCIAEN